MKSFVKQGVMAGAVTLIARRGEVVSLEAVGFQDLESKKPMRADTIFDIRSVTKPVTAIGIMILMEEGKLALNEPVDKYLPEPAWQPHQLDRPADCGRPADPRRRAGAHAGRRFRPAALRFP